MNLKLGDWTIPEIPGGMPAVGTTFTREIIGDTYPTIIMPGGTEWMAKNLSYLGLGVPCETTEATNLMGRLYSYLNIPALEALLGDGWHVPSRAEWDAMILACGYPWSGVRYTDAEALKATSSDYWDSPNTGAAGAFSFNWMGAGYFQSGGYRRLRKTGGYLTSTPDGGNVYAIEAMYDISGVSYASNFQDSNFSVRLMRDAVPLPSTPAQYGDHDIILDGDTTGRAILENNLAQRVDVRLRTFLGEHWLNPEIGVPYFDEFLVKNPNLSVCRALLLTVVQGVPGVTQVTRLDLSFSKNTNARVLNVIFTVVGTDSIPQTGTTVVPA